MTIHFHQTNKKSNPLLTNRAALTTPPGVYL